MEGMDISIHTLTGTIFDLRVSPFESVLSIKSKLERLEGIPTCQQHLIWQSTELKDDQCLHDYDIKSGATLRLVLAMRDGPVNMRRIEVAGEPLLDGVELLMNEQNKDELWETLMTSEDKKHVTFLVFCEGDHVNFFRVSERIDGEEDNQQSPRNGTGSEEDEEENEENVITKDKMIQIRKQIEAKCLKKEARIIQASRPPSTAILPPTKILSPSANLTNRLLPSRDVPSQCSNSLLPTPNASETPKFFDMITPSPLKDLNGDSPLKEILRETPDNLHPKSSLSPTTPLPPIPAIPGPKRTDSITQNERHTTELPEHLTSPGPSRNVKLRSSSSRANMNSKNSCRQRKGDKKDRKSNNSGQSNGSLGGSCRLPNIAPYVPSQISENHGATEKDSFLHLPGIEETAIAQKESRINLLSWLHNNNNNNNNEDKRNDTNSNTIHKGTCVNDSIGSIPRMRPAASGHVMKCLPPICSESVTTIHGRTKGKGGGKNKVRCFVCTKKLGLTTTYECRCGGSFCPKHRYPETHTCSFDYKTEGRRMLERNNPVVTAPKLPKI